MANFKKEDIKIIDHYVDMDEVELANIDSLLVDSGTTLATLDYKLPNSDFVETISLEVRGEVKIFYKGDYFFRASEYPKEVKDILRLPYMDRLEVEDFEIIDNNWCELFYTLNGDWQYDTDVVDGEFGETEEEIIDYLTDMAYELCKEFVNV